MSLAITAVIGAAIASMVAAVARGTQTGQSVRGLVTRHKILEARLNTALRDCSMILASGNSYIVLWMGDTNADGAINLSELRRIELDNSNNLTSYKAVFPSNWSPSQIAAADTAYDASSNFNTVTTGLKGNSLFPVQTWMPSVNSVTFTPNDPNPQLATMLSYRVALTSAGQASTAIGAASLRN